MQLTTLLAMLVLGSVAAVPLADADPRQNTLFALPENQTQSLATPSVIACIVEPRLSQMPLIDYVVDNVASFLPWGKIQFYHGASTHPCSEREPVGRTCKLFKEGRVELHNLHIDNLDVAGYSRLLSSTDFWKAKAGYKKTLIFQTDSVFCNATHERIQNFMGLDYVGSHARDEWTPIANGGNGGFSLRDTQRSLECSTELGLGVPEDAHFVQCISMRGGRMATREEQDRWGTQNFFLRKSLGAHQINAQLLNNNGSFREYCPQYLVTMKIREHLPERLPALSSAEHLRDATPP